MASPSAIPFANRTIFGSNVFIFDSKMPVSAIEDQVNDIFRQMESNEFGPQRYALLFKPGSYDVLFNVGFYTSVAGLGQSPDDVLIKGGINVSASWMPHRNATCNFWRSLENLAIDASAATNRTTAIAVSQAAPLRRMHIKSANGLWLFEVDPESGAGGWASGGFMADSRIDGQVLPGSQQQWFSRNSTWKNWANGVWNMVFLGCQNAPSQDNFPQEPYTTVDRTPIIREKPYLYLTEQGDYAVFKPALQTDTFGPSWSTSKHTIGTSVSIDQFYIAQPHLSSAQSINSALQSGKHVILTPGIYQLEEALRVTNCNTIIIGLGFPSLIPTTGQPAVIVSDVDGVTLASFIVDAGPLASVNLIELGPTNSTTSHASNPTLLFDITVRTGGPNAGENETGIIINSRHVVCDQLWLWRADHGEGAGWKSNATRHGLVVRGSDVTVYGLFNEHHKEYQTLWYGDGGRLYFYQSEIPYDPPCQEEWMAEEGKVNGYASYKVDDCVTSHEAWGLGVYSYFRDAPVKLENAIEVPDVDGVKLHHLTTVWLNGVAGSEITHIVNGLGGSVLGNTPESAMRQTMKHEKG